MEFPSDISIVRGQRIAKILIYAFGVRELPESLATRRHLRKRVWMASRMCRAQKREVKRPKEEMRNRRHMKAEQLFDSDTSVAEQLFDSDTSVAEQLFDSDTSVASLLQFIPASAFIQ